MDRRDFLKTTGAAAAATAIGGQSKADAQTVSAPHIAKGLRQYRIALSWPDNCRGPGESARRLTQAIEQASEGRIGFSFTTSQRAGEALSDGSADMIFSNADEGLGRARAYAYFAGLPGHHSLSPQHHAQWLLVGGGAPLWDELAATHGMKFLLAGHTGHSSGLWSKSRIEGAGALKDRVIWAGGLGSDVVRGLGAEPSQAPPLEIGAAFQSDRLHAADVGGMISAFSAGLTDLAPYRLPCAVTQNGSSLALGVPLHIWDSFTRTEQALIEAAAHNEYQTMLAEEMANKRLLPAPASGQIERIASIEIQQAIHRVSDAVVAHLAAQDRQTSRINASYMAFKQLVHGDEPVA